MMIFSKIFKTIIFILACVLVTSRPKAFFLNKNVIYDSDDRYEVSDYPDARFRTYAKSVAAKVISRNLTQSTDGDIFTFDKTPLTEIYNVCEDERFAKQAPISMCTGFLVAPNLLLTSGHCMRDQKDCDYYKWIFSYTNQTKKFKKNDIYRCKEIIKAEFIDSKYNYQDYAIIRLDRKVKGRNPLKVRTKGKIKTGTPLVSIGHSSALPLKISDNAKVKKFIKHKDEESLLGLIKRRKNYFLANLDTYFGNSGSPIFNEETGLVEGILSQGGDDYYIDEKQECRRSIIKEKNRFDAEELIFKITKVKGLEKLLKN